MQIHALARRLALALSLVPSLAVAQVSNPFAPNPLYIGPPSYSDTGVAGQMTGSNAAYYQWMVQNTNAGTGASADFIVGNNLGTASTYYGDFGINSSNFSGTGSLALASATYLYSQNGDLAVGTGTGNAVHFVVNSGATDAGTIDTTAHWRIGGATGTPSIANNACGSTSQGTVTAGSNDHTGKVTVGTALVTSCAISFATTYAAAPVACLLSPANATGALWNTTGAYVSAISTTSFTITGLALAGASFYFHCL